MKTYGVPAQRGDTKSTFEFQRILSDVGDTSDRIFAAMSAKVQLGIQHHHYLELDSADRTVFINPGGFVLWANSPDFL
ncbi:hypothetical protein ACFQAT_28115 [Undibacterium arcticum]|uniref:Uncharacterized protein n=1 Tax=Undibacterium arcticum TaxID=1762892 RepID=A0ABV7F7H6_9BURK